MKFISRADNRGARGDGVRRELVAAYSYAARHPSEAQRLSMSNWWRSRRCGVRARAPGALGETEENTLRRSGSSAISTDDRLTPPCWSESTRGKSPIFPLASCSPPTSCPSRPGSLERVRPKTAAGRTVSDSLGELRQPAVPNARARSTQQAPKATRAKRYYGGCGYVGHRRAEPIDAQRSVRAGMGERQRTGAKVNQAWNAACVASADTILGLSLGVATRHSARLAGESFGQSLKWCLRAG